MNEIIYPETISLLEEEISHMKQCLAQGYDGDSNIGDPETNWRHATIAEYTSAIELLKSASLLKQATRFELGNCVHHNRPVSIESRDQTNGSRKWVLKMHEWVLAKDGKFYYEPRPSSRSDKFIDATRFNTVEECHQFWVKNVNKKMSLSVKGSW